MAGEETAHTPWASLFSVALSILIRDTQRTKKEQRSLLKRVKLPLLPVSRYLNRQGDFQTMVSILYKCPHFYFPRVYSLRITFVDYRYSLIQARKERLKSQKIKKFSGLTRRKRQAAVCSQRNTVQLKSCFITVRSILVTFVSTFLFLISQSFNRGYVTTFDYTL